MPSNPSGFQSSPPPPSLSRSESALAQASRLLNLIDAEFESLKKQDLSAFESLQPEKLELLTQLDALAQKIQQGQVGDTDAEPWSQFKDTIRRCQDGYRRNETLISRQLMTIRGALRALSGANGPESVEMYDRLGQLTNHARRDRYNEA
jgi:flagellar biosynthesis/type III secretory pathway chaperone